MQKDFVFEVIISDAMCLVTLTKIGQLELLKKLYGRVTITPEVLEEFTEKHKDKLPEWVDVKEAKSKKMVDEIEQELGRGESSSIVLACETPGSMVIIDDKDARDYAFDMGLSIIGTVGVIKRAIERNIIESHEKANELFKKLKAGGFWLKDKFVENIKYPINSEENSKSISKKR